MSADTRLVKLSLISESQIHHALGHGKIPPLPETFLEADARIADGEIGDAVMHRLEGARAVRVRWSLPGRVDLLVAMDDGAVVKNNELGALQGALSRTPPPPTIEVHVPDQRPRAARAQRNADGTIDITYDNGSDSHTGDPLPARAPIGFRA